MNLSRTVFFLTCLGIKFVFSDSSIDWMDIPSTDYSSILSIEKQEVDHLNKLASKYHSIDKASLTTQEARIELLNTISAHLIALSQQEKLISKKSTLLLLDQAVQNKREYLKQLLQIPPDESIERYHLDFSSETETHFEPIPLRNNSTYSLKMKEFWGKFWLESIDPCHRRLANYHQFWLDTNPICQDYKSFFLWLESQPIQKNIPIVNYFSEAQLAACHVQLINGNLRKSATQEIVNTDSTKRNLFIIDLSKELYIEAYKEGVWHTSLSRGKPVLGAGLLDVEKGIVKMVAFESGHYLPSLEQSFQSLQILHEKGIPFQEPLQLIYFENRNKYKISVSRNDITKYQNFYEAIHDSTKRELVSTNEF